MTLNRSERIEQLFSEALELPLKQRPDWLREQCGSDTDLYSEILDLLTELDAQDYRLERGAMVHVAAPHVSDTLFQPSVPGYQLTSRLAVGGQAIVYEAIQNSTEQRVAVKLLRAGTLSTEDEQLRFSQEVAALAKIQHPHIVPIIDSGRTEQGIPFLVTQFVNGLPVDKYVDQELRGNDDANPDPTKLLPLFIKIADAVHVAHKQGIIHRDLKPSNILVDMYGEPRLLDFGVAKPIRSPDDREEKAITVTGGFPGLIALGQSRASSWFRSHRPTYRRVFAWCRSLPDADRRQVPVPDRRQHARCSRQHSERSSHAAEQNSIEASRASNDQIGSEPGEQLVSDQSDARRDRNEGARKVSRTSAAIRGRTFD